MADPDEERRIARRRIEGEIENEERDDRHRFLRGNTWAIVGLFCLASIAVILTKDQSTALGAIINIAGFAFQAVNRMTEKVDKKPPGQESD